MEQWAKRSGIMLFYPFEEKRLAKWKPPFIVQPKLDGERCRAEIFQKGYRLISSELNLFPHVAHIKRELIELGFENIELDGELYTHGWDFSQIHSVASTARKEPHPDEKFLQYHIFDFVSEEAQIIRTDRVNDFPEGKYVKVVPSYIVWTFDEIYGLLKQFHSQGYEGIIVRELHAPYVRKRSVFGMKWKPKKKDDYMIKGYSVEVDKNGIIKLPLRIGRFICTSDENLGFLGEFPPKAKIPEGYFSVGSGFTDAQRFDFWEQREMLVGHYMTVEYQHLTSKKGVPRFGIFVNIKE